MSTSIRIISGDRILWSYMHSLNRTSQVERTKFGVFKGLVRQKIDKYGYHEARRARVRFDGNRTDSIVLFSELNHEKYD